MGTDYQLPIARAPDGRCGPTSGSQLTRILFDDRSAHLQRTTGWERYVRGLAKHLPAGVTTTTSAFSALGTAKILSDFQLDLARRSQRVHFTTFPPLRPRGSYVLTIHDLTWWRFPETASRLGRSWYSRLAERSIQSAVAIACHSAAMADEAADYFSIDRSRFHVVSPGVELPAPAEGWSPPVRGPYLLALGSFEPRKNLRRLVQAYAISKLANDGVSLVAIGRRAWGEVPDGMVILQNVTDEQVAAAYRSASGVVLPSLHEGFGLPPVEALAVGTPVACSDLPVLREVTGGYATYFDPNSTDEIRQALRDLVHQPTVPSAAQAYARQYTWEAAGRQLTDLYQRIGWL